MFHTVRWKCSQRDTKEDREIAEGVTKGNMIGISEMPLKSLAFCGHMHVCAFCCDCV